MRIIALAFCISENISKHIAKFHPFDEHHWDYGFQTLLW